MKNAVHYDVVPALGADGGGGERMSRTVVAPASSSVRSGFSTPMIRRFREKGWSCFLTEVFFFFAAFAGGFAAFFCIVLLLLNIRPRLSGLEPDRII